MARRGGEGPERLCLVLREARPPDALIRFVLGPDGTVVPDLRRRLPGRGVWVTATAMAVGQAVKRKLFAKGFKGPAPAPAGLVESIDALMQRDAIQALSFAHKAGEAVGGFARTERAIASGAVVAVLHAREAAPDGMRKLQQALTRAAAEGEPAAGPAVEVINTLSEADLGLALGGPHVIHAALVAGPASAGFLARWRRLARFRGIEPADQAGPLSGAATRPDDH